MKAVGRRGFLRLMAAAPVAAPSMAKEAASHLGNAPAPTPAYYHNAKDIVSTTPPDPFWAAKRRKELEAQSRGEFEDDDNPYHKIGPRLGDAGFDCIDSLRSVSTAAKRLMANELSQRRERENRMKYAAYELRQFLKQHALAGLLV